MIKHPNFIHKKYIETPDIALIEVGVPFEFNQNVNKILIKSQYLDDNFKGLEAGWGSFIDYKQMSDKLLYMDTQIITNYECRSRFRTEGISDYIADNKICTLNSAGQGACKGKSTKTHHDLNLIYSKFDR